MAILRPPFDLATATLFSAPDRLITFPDRYTSATPIAQARFENSQLWLMTLTPAAGHTTIPLQCPADSAVKSVDLQANDAAALGFPKLLELSLMPFALTDVLRAMKGGVPTFYWGYSGVAYPVDDEAIRTTDPAITVPSAVLGIMFQDRMTMAPWAWFDRIAAAVRAVSPANAPPWESLAEIFSGRRQLRLLNVQGQPFAGQGLTLALTDLAGNAQSTSTAVSDVGGIVTGLTLPGANQKGVLSWQPNPMLTDMIPVMALIDAPQDTTPGQNAFPVPSGFVGGHLQLLQLADWFAPNLETEPTSPNVGARYRLNSRMEPLVDGIPTYKRLLEDLAFTKGTNGSASFGGWKFTAFPIQQETPRTSLLELSQDIVAAGGKVHILASQFLQATDATLDSLGQEAGLYMLIFYSLGTAATAVTNHYNYTSSLGLAAWTAIAVGAVEAFAEKLAGGDNMGKVLRKLAEETDPDYFPLLQAAATTALWSPHPVTFQDNPLSADLPLPDGRKLADIQNRFGVFHEKIQLVKYADGIGPANQCAAYVGGIDINDNRVDSPGHQAAGFIKVDSTDPPMAAPFHDVHTRITGPAAGEVFQIFAQRHAIDLKRVSPNAPDPGLFQPAPNDLPAAGRHIMQVAQTSFRPASASGTTGFPWALEGNLTIQATIRNAIRAAREYIYIEEQYMVASEEYIHDIVAAAQNCKRLIIVLPSFLEIFFGDRRRGAMFDLMSPAWGGRMLIGTPMRRPVLAPTNRTTSQGRCVLLAPIGAGDATMFVGPSAHVPGGRFFFWIGGELMFATNATPVTGPGGKPAMELDVLRGGLGSTQRWCPDPRPHVAGEPVTMSQPTGIFVHAKIMMVDDVFCSIGSTNINRRGFYHDGEISAFSVPQDLRTAADNPARDLRTRLWAEQLGLSPDMGASLLADPMAGFEFFRRSRYEGNRFTQLSELSLPTPTLSDLPDIVKAIPDWVKNLLQFSLETTLEAFSDDIFNTLSDPTTTLEDNPQPGPGLH